MAEFGHSPEFGTAFAEGWERFFADPGYEAERQQFEELKETTRIHCQEAWVCDDEELTRRWVAAVSRAAILGMNARRRAELDDLEVVELALITVYQTTVLGGAWDEDGVAFSCFDIIDGEPDLDAEEEIETGEIIDLRTL